MVKIVVVNYAIVQQGDGESMTHQEILKHVDHTLLAAYATWEDIETLCKEGVEYHTASVCIPPNYVRRVKERFGETLPVCTVVGFPLGYSVSAAKAAETEQAIRDGAAEIDMVINISDVKNQAFAAVEHEIALLRGITGNRVLKVIIETCYLNALEKQALCAAVTNAGADYIKTSTGFGSAGAMLADVALFREYLGKGVRIKAAGGIRSFADMEAFLAAGVDRIGCSSAIRLIRGEDAGSR